MPGHRIKIVFQQFALDDHQECIYDYIQFHDGDSVESWTISARYCGVTLPPVIKSFTNNLFMVLHSEYGGGKGFQASYISECGGRLRASDEEKSIYSHALYGLENYQNNLFCRWQIDPPSGSNVLLKFISFDLEKDLYACSHDYIILFDDLEYSEYVIGRYCGKSVSKCLAGYIQVYILFMLFVSTIIPGKSIVHKS